MPRPVHFEIHADEPERAMRFYSCFGWEFSRWGDEEYWLVKTGPATEPGIDGGLMRRRGPPPAATQAVNAFPCVVDVPDLDGYVARVEHVGGVIVVPKMAMPGVGWLAYAKDTEGNIFGMMQRDAQARQHRGAPQRTGSDLLSDAASI
jgi:predicted enzyme related to lactoylglutathione lyase